MAETKFWRPLSQWRLQFTPSICLIFRIAFIEIHKTTP